MFCLPISSLLKTANSAVALTNCRQQVLWPQHTSSFANVSNLACQTLQLQTTQTAAHIQQHKAIFIDQEQSLFEHILKASTTLDKLRPYEIALAVRYTVRLSERNEISVKQREQIHSFFKKISELSESQWDRRALLANKHKLQCLLCDKLEHLYSQLQQTPELAKDEQYQLDVAVAKAELVTLLGVGAQPAGGGVNGAQIIKSLEGDAIGVFKPEKKLAWWQLGEHLKRFFGQSRLLSQRPLAQEYAEVAAHDLSRTLGFNITPAAKLCQLKNENGAFLAFLSNYKQAKDIVDRLEERNEFSDKEKTLFQKMAVYDFLSGNMDCHDENWFVRYKNEKIEEIRIIDHGNSFIESNPGNFGLKGNQYAWSRLKLAKESFTQETIDFVKSMSYESLKEFIATYRSNFLSTKMEQLIEERFWLLRDGLATQTIRSPQELACVRTDQDFATIHNKIVAQMKLDQGVNLVDEDDFCIIDIK